MPEEKEKQMMLGGMKAIFGTCPAIKGMPENILTYDEIIIGTPIWAGKNAPAMNTLLKSHEIRDKVTAVVTLSGGGDNDKCIAGLKKKLPNLAHTVALADRNSSRRAHSLTRRELIRLHQRHTARELEEQRRAPSRCPSAVSKVAQAVSLSNALRVCHLLSLSLVEVTARELNLLASLISDVEEALVIVLAEVTLLLFL